MAVKAKPKVSGKDALGSVKRLPKPVIFLVLAGVLVLLYIRHKNAQAAANAATTPTDGTDPSQYGADTTGLDQSYLSGYDSGLYSQDLPTDIYGGMGPGGGYYGSGSGSDNTGSGGNTQPTINITEPTINVPNTGGGPPKRPAKVHGGNTGKHKKGEKSDKDKGSHHTGGHGGKSHGGSHTGGRGDKHDHHGSGSVRGHHGSAHDHDRHHKNRHH